MPLCNKSYCLIITGLTPVFCHFENVDVSFMPKGVALGPMNVVSPPPPMTGSSAAPTRDRSADPLSLLKVLHSEPTSITLCVRVCVCVVGEVHMAIRKVMGVVSFLAMTHGAAMVFEVASIQSGRMVCKSVAQCCSPVSHHQPALGANEVSCLVVLHQIGVGVTGTAHPVEARPTRSSTSHFTRIQPQTGTGSQ